MPYHLGVKIVFLLERDFCKSFHFQWFLIKRFNLSKSSKVEISISSFKTFFMIAFSSKRDFSVQVFTLIRRSWFQNKPEGCVHFSLPFSPSTAICRRNMTHITCSRSVCTFVKFLFRNRQDFFPFKLSVLCFETMGWI